MDYIGQCENRKAMIKDYRENPGDFNMAAHAAYYYAKKYDQLMIVIPGNSYMKKVFHISYYLNAKKFLLKDNNQIAIVYPNGNVYQTSVKDYKFKHA